MGKSSTTKSMIFSRLLSAFFVRLSLFEPSAKQFVSIFFQEIQLIAPEVPAVENLEKKPNSEAQEPQKTAAHVPVGESSTRKHPELGTKQTAIISC